MLTILINTSGSPHWICMFILMFVSFLLGWFLKGLGNNKTVTSLHKNKEEESDLPIEEPNDIEIPSSGVRARKTMERQGVAVKKEALDFEQIGTATAQEKEDLKQINGIGPVIEEKLNSIGIYTLNQISNLKETDIETVTRLIAFSPGKIKRDDWKGQAKTLLEDKNEE